MSSKGKPCRKAVHLNTIHWSSEKLIGKGVVFHQQIHSDFCTNSLSQLKKPLKAKHYTPVSFLWRVFPPCSSLVLAAVLPTKSTNHLVWLKKSLKAIPPEHNTFSTIFVKGLSPLQLGLCIILQGVHPWIYQNLCSACGHIDLGTISYSCILVNLSENGAIFSLPWSINMNLSVLTKLRLTPEGLLKIQCTIQLMGQV